MIKGDGIMAYLKQAKTESEIKSLTVANVKKAYNDLAKDYSRIIEQDLILCPCCGEFITRENFYTDKRYAIGLFPQCKKCVLAEVEQRKNKNDKPNETKESVKRMLQKMDLPYIDSLYESLQTDVANEINEKNKKSPFLAYLPPIKSLPNWKGKTYKDSEFELGVITEEEETKQNAKTIKNGKKRFGLGLSNEDYMFLENEYQDWITRYECSTKTQEEIFERLSFKKWEINKATKSGQNTKDLDKTYQELMTTANIAPRQTTMDTMSDAQTFGTLIQKYEETRPLPDIDPELEDIDKIGLYIDSFYRGHACKMLGLKNSFSHLYEKVMSKYTVTPPEYDDETDSEILFEKIFGSVED
jgi:hypothetical protein